MQSLRLWILSVFCLALFDHLALAASFDCEKAATKVEKMICSADYDLHELDNDVASTYRRLMKQLSPERADALKGDQREWLKKRNKCADINCLRKVYESRRFQFLSEGVECLQSDGKGKMEYPYNRETLPHLTVSSSRFVGDLTIQFTGIPIYNDIFPKTEGCIDTDASVLIYRTKDETPLFFRAGIWGEVLTRGELQQRAKTAPKFDKFVFTKLYELSKADQLTLIYGAPGSSCGGCFSILTFATTPDFKMTGTYWFDPDKYQTEGGPNMRAYDANQNETARFRPDQ